MINPAKMNRIIDEAYFGRGPVKGIEQAMRTISEKVQNEPNIRIETDPANKALEDAVQSTFGFKSVKIFWSNQAGGRGPYTLPGSVIINYASDTTGGLKYGTHKNGFYDKGHVIKLYVQLDQNLIRDCGCTPEELTGILLHEIGHNFDYSFMTLYSTFIVVIDAIFKSPQAVLQYFTTTAIQHYGREVIARLLAFNETLSNLIPPFGVVIRTVGKIGFKLTKILNNLFTPLTIFMVIPVALLTFPINYFNNFITGARGKEVFSDTFAASYGYGDACITGLEKIYRYATVMDGNSTLTNWLGDLTLLQSEIVQLACGAHGTDQQRMIRIMSKLEDDLTHNQYDPALKKDLEKQLEQCKYVYKKLLGLRDTERETFQHKFRQMVDNWYAGKDYIMIPRMHMDDAK